MPDLTSQLSQFLTQLYQGTFSMPGALAVTRDGLGTTSVTDALLLQNSTPSTAGVPVQNTPRLSFLGHAWNTGSGADNTDQWWLDATPTSGATPSSLFRIMSQRNGGTAVAGLTITPAGSLTLLGNIEIAATRSYYWNTRTIMTSPANGQVNLTNFAASAGAGLDVATDGVLKVRTRAQNAYAQVDALGYSVSGVAGASKAAGAVASITVVNGIVTAIS